MTTRWLRQQKHDHKHNRTRRLTSTWLSKTTVDSSTAEVTQTEQAARKTSCAHTHTPVASAGSCQIFVQQVAAGILSISDFCCLSRGSDLETSLRQPAWGRLSQRGSRIGGPSATATLQQQPSCDFAVYPRGPDRSLLCDSRPRAGCLSEVPGLGVLLRRQSCQD